MPATSTTIEAAEVDEDAAIRRVWGENLTERMAFVQVTNKRLVQLLSERGIDVTPQAVGQWKSGQTAPRPHVMVAIAACLGCTPRSLFTLDVIRVAA